MSIKNDIKPGTILLCVKNCAGTSVPQENSYYDWIDIGNVLVVISYYTSFQVQRDFSNKFFKQDVIKPWNPLIEDVILYNFSRGFICAVRSDMCFDQSFKIIASGN